MCPNPWRFGWLFLGLRRKSGGNEGPIYIYIPFKGVNRVLYIPFEGINRYLNAPNP